MCMVQVCSAQDDGKVFDSDDAQLILDKGTPRCSALHASRAAADTMRKPSPYHPFLLPIKPDPLLTLIDLHDGRQQVLHNAAANHWHLL